MSVRADYFDHVGRAVLVSLAVALWVPALGCHKQQDSSSPESSGMDQAGEARAPGDSADATDPVAELSALEGRMRAFGLPIAADRKAATAEGESDGVGEAGVAGDDDGREEAAPAPSPTEAQVGATAPMRDETVNYCGDLCSLSESICTLEVRICSLAQAHASDTIYADACERAVEDCEVAGEACDSCG
jgi:hypothetical protein